LIANGFIYNPFDHRLYVSVSGQEGAVGNSIAVIDPFTGSVEKTIYVGSEPASLALSDDGEVLYVVLTGSNSARRLDKLVPGSTFSLSERTSSSAKIMVMPGSHDSVAVVDGTIIVYDNGVPRPYTYEARYGVTTASPNLLYTCGETFQSGCNVLCANQFGVFYAQSIFSLGGVEAALSFAKNVVYAIDGTAYDIATGKVLGTYPVAGFTSSFVPDPIVNRVFFLTSPGPLGSQLQIVAFDLALFTRVAAEDIPAGYHGAEIVRWGRFGLALRNTDTYGIGSGGIRILRTPLVPSVP
jgi:YVTN family beta-propeller protein